MPKPCALYWTTKFQWSASKGSVHLKKAARLLPRSRKAACSNISSRPWAISVRLKSSTVGATKKADYFKAAEQAWADWHAVVDLAWNPLDRLIQVLAEASSVEVGVAEEPGFGKLFAGIIRKASKGIGRHSDYAPFNAPDYSIGQIDAQLGWNLFFDVPGSGGETIIYNRPWTVEVKPGEEPPMSFGLTDEVVAGADTARYAAAAGDVVIFNSRNPHEVTPGEGGDRLQIGSFIGRRPDGSLVLWS